MKYLFILFTFILFGFSSRLHNSCKEDYSVLKKMLDEGYEFLGPYAQTIEPGDKMQRYTVVIHKDANFQLLFYDKSFFPASAKKLTITISSAEGKVLAATQLDQVWQGKLNFSCPKTGVYYLQLESDGTACAAAIISVNN